MTTEEVKKHTGQKVIVEFKGLQLVGKLLGLVPNFGDRDALVQIPGIQKTRKFWKSKITVIKK